jgi:hypothetical protein
MRKILFLLLIFSSTLHAQTADSLSVLSRLIQKGKNDSTRIAANEIFLAGFEKFIERTDCDSVIRDSIKNVSVIIPDDNHFRIYTWVLPHFDGNKYDYFGFLKIIRENTFEIIKLHDSTSVIRHPESEKLNPTRWLGSVYYNIVEIKIDKLPYYTLFGWKGTDEHKTQKIIDVLYIDKGKPKFGYPLFKTESVYKNRMIFSYDAQASMTLNYDNNFKGIVFDHITNNDAGISGPDGTYDAFKLKKGKWVLMKDVDVRTKWQPDNNKLKIENEK